MKINSPNPRIWVKNTLRTYEIRPIATSLFFGALFNVALNTDGYTLNRDARYVLQGSLLGLSKALTLFLFLIIISILQKRNLSKWLLNLIYVFGIPTSAFCASLVGHRDEFISFNLFLSVRNIFSLFLFCAIMGKLRENIQNKIDELSAAKNILQAERTLLLESEERIRQEIADLLHDKIQSDLIVSAMTLEQLAKDLPTEPGNQIRSVIEVLEEIRVNEIRTLSHRLTPEIETAGLRVCLDDLSASYSRVLKVHINMDLDVEKYFFEAGALAFAVYRIIEQGLQNAVVHGKSTRVDLGIIHDGKTLLVRMANNGRPLSPYVGHSGSGLTVIRAWAEAFGGVFSLSNSRDASVVLEARFPLTI